MLRSHLNICGAEGAGVVLAGLQPRFDAVFVDGVDAAQRVAALAIHRVLAHQTELTGSAGVPAPCCSVHGRRWSLGRGVGRRAADGSRRGLALCQHKPDPLGGFVDGHARQRAPGALHLPEQPQQLMAVALREASPQLLQDVGGAGRGRGGGNCPVGRLYGRRWGEVWGRRHPGWKADLSQAVRLRQRGRVGGWEAVRGWEAVGGWGALA